MMFPALAVSAAMAALIAQPAWVEQQTGISTQSPGCHETVMAAKAGTITSVPANLSSWCVGSVKMALTHPENVEAVDFGTNFHLPF